MQKLIARARVVVKAAPTYLVGASTVVVVAADEIAKVVPGHAEQITSIGLKVVAALGAAVAIVRRVTPAPAGQRGLLENGSN